MASPAQENTCHQYGYILERTNKQNVSICAAPASEVDKSQRERAVYSSTGNGVEMILVAGRNVNNTNFLIQLHGITFDFGNAYMLTHWLWVE